jgi:hypothetical protein
MKWEKLCNQNCKIDLRSLLKKIQRRGARRSMSGGVLLYVDAKSIERNEAYGSFSAAWLLSGCVSDGA